MALHTEDTKIARATVDSLLPVACSGKQKSINGSLDIMALHTPNCTFARTAGLARFPKLETASKPKPWQRLGFPSSGV